MDFSTFAKHVIDDVEYVTFAHMCEKVPDNIRLKPVDWKKTLTWISASGIPPDSIMVAKNKFTAKDVRGIRSSKNNVIIPIEQLIENLSKMLVQENPTIASTALSTENDIKSDETKSVVPKMTKRKFHPPQLLPEIVLHDNEGFVFDDETIYIPVYGERTMMGIRFPEITVCNILGVSDLACRIKTMDTAFYESILCDDNRMHYFFTFVGLLNEIVNSKSVIGKAMRSWVLQQVFDTTYATPEEKLKCARDKLAAIANTFDLSASPLGGELILCLGKVCDIPEDQQKFVKDWAPDDLVYRHTHSSDIETRIKQVGGKHIDGRVVSFMIGNKGAMEEIDKKFKAAIVEKGIKACNKLFTTTDESEVIKIFESIVHAQDGTDPTIALYRDIQADLDRALLEIEHLQKLVEEKSLRIEEGRTAFQKIEDGFQKIEDGLRRELACKDEVIAAIRSVTKPMTSSRSLHIA
jgi:hypothetical protein